MRSSISNDTEFNFEKVYSDAMKWSKLNVSIADIAEENAELVRDLAKYNSEIAVPFIGSLLTVPELHSNTIRIEVLLTLAIVYCRGNRTPNLRNLEDWYRMIGQSKCTQGEDPAENVFVSLVCSQVDDYKLLQGTWESAGFYTQHVLNVVESLFAERNNKEVERVFLALLKLSDFICQRSGLVRYQEGSESSVSRLSTIRLPPRKILVARQTITAKELECLEIEIDDIRHFFLDQNYRTVMAGQHVYESEIISHPLKQNRDGSVTILNPAAMSVAARIYVLEMFKEQGLIDVFDEELAKSYSKMFFNTPLLGGEIGSVVTWQEYRDYRMSTFCTNVSAELLYSFSLILPSSNSGKVVSLNEPSVELNSTSSEIRSSISDSAASSTCNEESKRGLVFIVYCGWGRDYIPANIEETIDGRAVIYISAADLICLSWQKEISPVSIWRIIEALGAVSKQGVEIINMSGLLNIVSWISQNNGYVVPENSVEDLTVFPESPLVISIPVNTIRNARLNVDKGYDLHHVVDNFGEGHVVKRRFLEPYFISEGVWQQYVSLSDLERNISTVVYEGRFCIWMSVHTPNVEDKELRFQLWGLTSEWLHRIGFAIEDLFSNSSEKSVCRIDIAFEENFQLSTDSRNSVNKKSEGMKESVSVVEEYNWAQIRFKAGFIDVFRKKENEAERQIVKVMISAIYNVLNFDESIHSIRKVEDIVVRNTSARKLHIFQSFDYHDSIRSVMPKSLVTIDPVQYISFGVGLTWKISGMSKDTKRIDGKEDCTHILHSVVDTIFDEIVEELKAYNRIEALTRIILNSERASSDQAHWRRTAGSVIGLYGNVPDTTQRAVSELSKIASANSCSRVLGEIALCACPLDGGVKLSDLALGGLIAKVALLVHYGGVSDAVYYDVMLPELRISALGDILVQYTFEESVAKPVIRELIGSEYIASARDYGDNLDRPKSLDEAKQMYEREFWEIWNNEMGFEFEQGLKLLASTEGIGVKRKTPVIRLTTNEYKELAKSIGFSELEFDRFLERFSLVHRAKWTCPPDGFFLSDIYPWKFGRRLSYVARPILKLEEKYQSILLVAPAALQKSYFYIFHGAYYGTLDQSFFQTSELKSKWIGKVREGHSFATEVANKITQAKWTVRSNIGMAEILNIRLDIDYGDVDVLAWFDGRDEVLVIECKDLSQARNYSEIASQLSEYRGITSHGKPDKLKRHLNRVSLLQRNLKKLSSFTGIENPKILSCLTCSGIVPMQYAEIDALENTFVGSVEELLASLI